MIQFEVGKTYYARSICDHNCIYVYTVIKRTNSFITVKDKKGKIKRRKIEIFNNTETIKPNGNYSMAVILSASSTKEIKPDWENPSSHEYKASRRSKIHSLKRELTECLEELMQSNLPDKCMRAKSLKDEFQQLIDEIQNELNAIA